MRTEIFAGHVCEVVDYCTCDGGGEFPHRPECGLEPLYLVDERPEDDPAPVPTCVGRNCGGQPHE